MNEAWGDAEEESGATTDAAPPNLGLDQQLCVGARVRIGGLESEGGRRFNGRRGTVSAEENEAGRVAVQIDDHNAKPMLIKPEKLTVGNFDVAALRRVGRKLVDMGGEFADETVRGLFAQRNDTATAVELKETMPMLKRERHCDSNGAQRDNADDQA